MFPYLSVRIPRKIILSPSCRSLVDNALSRSAIDLAKVLNSDGEATSKSGSPIVLQTSSVSPSGMRVTFFTWTSPVPPPYILGSTSELCTGTVIRMESVFPLIQPSTTRYPSVNMVSVGKLVESSGVLNRFSVSHGWILSTMNKLLSTDLFTYVPDRS